MASHPSEATLFQVMRRPRWVAALLFALALAAGFAALGQWQLARAIESGHVVQRPTETSIPLSEAAKPGADLRSSMVGQLVTLQGSFSSQDYTVLDGRLNNGATGYWVVGHLTLAEQDASRPVAVAVARGWAPTAAAARAAVAELSAETQTVRSMVGRILPTEAPEAPDPNGDPYAMKDMSTAALVNLWHGVGNADVYTAYIVERGTPPAGLDAIYSPPPIEQATIDWLNVFYAAEWAVFAGFAVFLWYRVVRDAWEREIEDARAASAAPVAAESSKAENVD